jgi:hypothetical protein
MPAMTYTSLVNQVMDYLDRTDADTQNEVPNFIYQAEQRICRESKNIGLEQYVTGNFTVGVPVLAKPARWRRTITFSFGSGTGNNTVNQLFLRTYDYIRKYCNNATLQGPPVYYSDYGYDHLLVGPAPDQTYPFEYAYLELPQPLGVTNQTNWITNNAPDVLLYATLLEAIPFLKDDERVPVWTSYYERGIQSINNQDNLRVTDRTSSRDAD